VHAFIQATRETLGRSQAELGRPKSTIRAIQEEAAGQREDVVGVVELADGRTKRSRETIR
jgi:hypothetical protein